MRLVGRPASLLQFLKRQDLRLSPWPFDLHLVHVELPVPPRIISKEDFEPSINLGSYLVISLVDIPWVYLRFVEQPVFRHLGYSGLVLTRWYPYGVFVAKCGSAPAGSDGSFTGGTSAFMSCNVGGMNSNSSLVITGNKINMLQSAIQRSFENMA